MLIAANTRLWKHPLRVRVASPVTLTEAVCLIYATVGTPVVHKPIEKLAVVFIHLLIEVLYEELVCLLPPPTGGRLYDEDAVRSHEWALRRARYLPWSVWVYFIT